TISFRPPTSSVYRTRVASPTAASRRRDTAPGSTSSPRFSTCARRSLASAVEPSAVVCKFSREHWLVAAALFISVTILGALRMAPGVVGVFHDDVIYVATAKALAEGKVYRLIDLPGEPPQTKYPFLYPAVLAILWRLWPVFPIILVLLQGISLICTSSSIAIAFLYLARFGYFSKAEAASASLIGATSPVVL